MVWTLVSCYTPAYEKYLGDFTESLDTHGIKHLIIEGDELGSWNKNMMHKLVTIHFALSSLKTDIVWCDIDAKVINYPELFDVLMCDFAAFKLTVTPYNIEWVNAQYNFTPEILYYTGTMFFKNNDKNKQFLDKWIEIHEKYKDCNRPTQASLYWTLKEFPDLNVYDLPESYCWIKPYTVIEHYCASVVNNE